MRILVTGSSGFIGGKLCQYLKSYGHWVVGLDKNIMSSFCDETIIGDLCVEGTWSGALKGVDTVFHLAGKVHALSEVSQDDAAYYRINTEGTRKLLIASKEAGVKRFVFFSTIKAMSGSDSKRSDEKKLQYKHLGDNKIAYNEDDLVVPDTPYGRSKLEAEKLVLKGGYVQDPVVLRLCMVYGAGAKGNLHKMLSAIRRNRFPPLPEVGNRRSMVHVNDVVQAAILASEHPLARGEIFIVSDGRAYSTRQMYDMMCKALGRDSSRWVLPLWSLRGLAIVGDGIGKIRGRRFLFDSDALEKLVGSAYFDSRKIGNELGFIPNWSLEMALPEMIREIP